MVAYQTDTKTDAISDQFKGRLQGFAPERMVQAIVFIRTNFTKKNPKRRETRAERQAAIATIRKSGEAVLPEIDKILAQHGGKRLSDPNALGSILVETTVAGVFALAASENVSAILENQPVHLIR
jgi:malate synthase